MEDLEDRVKALEADCADYSAVLAAINALGANQRDQVLRLGSAEDRLGAIDDRLASVEAKLDDTNSRVRSLEQGQAEIKDLLVRGLGR